MTRFHPNIVLGLWATALLLFIASLVAFALHLRSSFTLALSAIVLLVMGCCMAALNLFGKRYSNEPLETGTVV